MGLDAARFTTTPLSTVPTRIDRGVDRNAKAVLSMKPSHGPAVRGGVFALLAATLFGISTPLVQRAGAGLGAFSTAALLYAGAAMVGALLRQPVEREAALRRSDFARLSLMALFGAGIGPVALAWGLQHTSGTSASLMLALEALFTALLARTLYHEVMDRRVWTAMLLLLGGGVVLVLDRGVNGDLQLLGLVAVVDLRRPRKGWRTCITCAAS